MEYLEKFLKKIARPFLGHGVIHKNFPFLITVFEKLYIFRKEKLMEISIPLNLRLKFSNRDTSLGLYFQLKGGFEQKQTEVFIKTLKKGDVFLDIGANIGYYTVIASKLVGPKGKVFAFEPDKENFKLLRKNLLLNECKNATLEQKAISNINGKVNFESKKFKKGESSMTKGLGSYSVVSATIDSYVKNEIPNINVVKMDIEGAEVMALEGAREGFGKQKNLKLFIECNPGSMERLGYKKEEFFNLLREIGFKKIYIIIEPNIITRYSPKTLEKVLRHTTYCNLLCLN